MKVLLEFKAGKMNLEETKLVPDSRKGRVKVVKWGPESETGMAIEENIIVMPEDADFKKVDSYKQSRQLKEAVSRMQEGDGSGDASLCQQFNAIINQQGQGTSMQGTSSGSATGVPDPSSLAQMLSRIAASGGGPSQPTQAPTLQQQAVLAAALLSSACNMPMTGVPKHPSGPSLAQILEPDVLMKYMQQPDMLDRLSEFLPESQRTEAALMSQCLSPQLHQQLKTFSAALQTGQFNPAALGLKVEGFSAIDFLNAIQKLVDEENSKQPKE